ncbi:response regulator [Asaia krungthepensis]|nr:response regulator [Asaia krungthepensis]
MCADLSFATARSSDIHTAPTVLVVEDQVLLRLYVSDMIEQAGYTVLSAENADEALTVISSNPQIRIVFSDLEMPSEMTGLELGHHLSRTRPEMGFVLTSGRQMPGSAALPPRGLFVPKPFLESDVCAALQRCVH